ncbi:MAG: hypothetical protein WDN28_20170 [Chthoniobacter sp.]
MSHKPNLFWVFALPASLVILAGAYYIKIPSARAFIDAHTSLGHQLFGSFVHDTVIVQNKPEQPDDPLALGINEKGAAHPAPGASPAHSDARPGVRPAKTRSRTRALAEESGAEKSVDLPGGPEWQGHRFARRSGGCGGEFAGHPGRQGRLGVSGRRRPGWRWKTPTSPRA